MAASSPVALILGAGANIGQNVGRAFAAKGYKIALAARSLKEDDSTSEQLHIKSDFSDPESISKIFAKVTSKFGTPHVVVYNAAAATAQDAKDPLGLPLAAFNRDFAINATSAFVAAQQAVLGFAKLPESASRTFIYTGNCTNVSPIVALMGSGAGKSATAHIIQCAAQAYKDKGFKFYYADERKEDGTPMYNAISGQAAGKYYVELAEGKTQETWHQTFVHDLGYKKF